MTNGRRSQLARRRGQRKESLRRRKRGRRNGAKPTARGVKLATPLSHLAPDRLVRAVARLARHATAA